jgi:hypothetical protein
MTMPERAAILRFVTALSVVLTAACGSSPSSFATSSIVTAPSALVTMSGVVGEGPPTQTRTIAGAKIEITSGTNKGATATSDSQGRYSLALVSGELTVQISRDGFATRTVQVTAPPDGTAVNFQLLPPADIVTETQNRNGVYAGRSIVVPVYNAGEIVVTHLSFYGFEEGDGMTLQVLQDGELKAEAFFERSIPANTVVLRVQVTAGHMIEVKAPEGSQSWNTISFTHPR